MVKKRHNDTTKKNKTIYTHFKIHRKKSQKLIHAKIGLANEYDIRVGSHHSVAQ